VFNPLQHGESEKLVKALFAVARDRQPSIIFIGKLILTGIRCYMLCTVSNL